MYTSETALRAFREARHTFIAGSRIDMGALAAALGVDRTSLFRWVGNRDRLLSEVLWSLAVPTLDAARRDAVGSGAARLVDVLDRFTADLIEAPYFRGFLTREPARALRLLTTTDSDVQSRFVHAVTELVAVEQQSGTFDPGAAVRRRTREAARPDLRVLHVRRPDLRRDAGPRACTSDLRVRPPVMFDR